MLDSGVVDEAAPSDERIPKTRTFVLSAIGLAVALSVAFFPMYFNVFLDYDDEGSFLTVIRQFLHHGDLYGSTHGPYGPFYFSTTGLVFKLIGHDPTLTSGRLVVLVITAVTVVMFGATVWRVTRSLVFSLFCEFVTYGVLIEVAGHEAMHPGSMIVLLLSVAAFVLVSYTEKRRTSSLVVVGMVIGALLMIKINIGIFVILAIAVAFVVGNREFSHRVQVVVATLAVLFPFVLMFQLLYKLDTFQFAFVTSMCLLATYATLSVDTVSLPPARSGSWRRLPSVSRRLSCIWPLATGTSPADLFHGVVIQPLGQASNLERSIAIAVQWIPFVITVAVVYAVLARRDIGMPRRSDRSWPLDLGLGLAGVVVLAEALFEGFGAWLPSIAVIPALAWLASARPATRIAMRVLVPLAIFQFLHAYPVVGSQFHWGLVAICLPCSIAIATAADRLPVWKQTAPAMRSIVVVSLGLFFVVGGGFWPAAVWHDYAKATPLGLPGTRFVRLDKESVEKYRKLTRIVKRSCDTFYSAPALDSLYIFTGIPPITGHLANAAGALEVDEQQQVANQIADARKRGLRVCIVRDDDKFAQWSLSSYRGGPLANMLFFFQHKVGQADNYSVSLAGPPRRPAAR